MNKGKTKTILLVEDEIIIAVSEQMLLEKYGYNVIISTSGEDAITKIEECCDIDLVLMDINLGRGIDGTETAELILSKKSIPIVFLSGLTEPEVVEKTERISSFGYIVKESDETVLIASLKMAFKLFEAMKKNEEKERLLLESEKKYYSLVELAVDGILLGSKEGNVIYANKCFCGILGMLPEELVGKHITELPFTKESKEKNPFRFDLLKAGLTVKNERTLINSDGEAVIVEMHSKMMPDGTFQSIYRDITERKKSDKILKESEYRFRNTFDNSAIGAVIVGLDKKFLKCNKAFCNYIGYEEEELLTKTVADITYPEDIDIEKNDLKRIVMGESKSATIQKRYVRKDGKIVWGEVSVSVVRDDDNTPLYFLPTIIDITERKENEEVIRESEGRFRFLFDNMAQGVVYYDSGGRAILTNKATLKMLGIEENTLIGKLPEELSLKCITVHSETFAIEEYPYMISLRTGKEVKNVIMGVYNKFDNKYRWLQINSFPQFRENENRPYQVFVTFSDISALKEANDEIQKQLRNMEILLREAHHRIKNNIASIINLISLQIDSIENNEAKSILRDTTLRVESMLVLYEKLLETTDYNEISTKAYLESLTDIIFSLYPENPSIRINKNIKEFPLAPKQMFALGMILNELLTNAMKYAFKGLDKGLIEIDLKENNSEVTMVIKDDGRGFPEGFEEKKSQGLGLLLVEMLAEQLNGEILFENSKGLKSTLKFNLN